MKPAGRVQRREKEHRETEGVDGAKRRKHYMRDLPAGISARRPEISRRASAQREVESAIMLTLYPMSRKYSERVIPANTQTSEPTRKMVIELDTSHPQQRPLLSHCFVDTNKYTHTHTHTHTHTNAHILTNMIVCVE